MKSDQIIYLPLYKITYEKSQFATQTLERLFRGRTITLLYIYTPVVGFKTVAIAETGLICRPEDGWDG